MKELQKKAAKRQSLEMHKRSGSTKNGDVTSYLVRASSGHANGGSECPILF
jgi:hypothetical protein